MYLIKIITIIFISVSLLKAEYTITNIDTNKSKAAIVLPYAFSSDSTGLAFGIGGILNGYIQDNMTIVATAYFGEALSILDQVSGKKEINSYGTFFGITNYQSFFNDRIFLSCLGSYSYYANQKIYIDGSSDSKKNDVLLTPGFSNWIEIPIRITLPLGENKDSPITNYTLKDGFVINRENHGGGLPFVTGSTVLEIKPFYSNFSSEKASKTENWKTNGIKFTLIHDNVDFIPNPSRGYRFKLHYDTDFDSFNSTQSWSNVRAQYTQFIELPNSRWDRQSVIALNIWSSYSPSWDTEEIYKDSHRPPTWEGSRLGGWNRMRAYDSNRFSDKAAIYYGIEHRIIPYLNPLKKKKWMPINIDWFQVVSFAEMGNVAPEFNLKELHTNLKWDVGMSLRALAANLPIRYDLAYGAEGLNMWVMINETF